MAFSGCVLCQEEDNFALLKFFLASSTLSDEASISVSAVSSGGAPC